jgi:hypothetical protein
MLPARKIEKMMRIVGAYHGSHHILLSSSNVQAIVFVGRGVCSLIRVVTCSNNDNFEPLFRRFRHWNDEKSEIGERQRDEREGEREGESVCMCVRGREREEEEEQCRVE